MFDNIQEIIERYIIPCNKHLLGAVEHPKFKIFENQQELEAALREEKAQDQNRIPYKLTILPEYPQYIVLAYIPRQTMTKEYIKVSSQKVLVFD